MRMFLKFYHMAFYHIMALNGQPYGMVNTENPVYERNKGLG